MGFNNILTKLFGNKSQRDLKEINPFVEAIKAAYPAVEALSNDQLRALSSEIRNNIQASVSAEKAEIERLKEEIETLELEEREKPYEQIDKIEKDITDKLEKALNDALPQVFSIVKDTARRFKENEKIVVTANDFDRNLAATHDFVHIEGDKAIYQNHWLAGGNEIVWDMVHYDVQLFGGVVLNQGKIA